MLAVDSRDRECHALTNQLSVEEFHCRCPMLHFVSVLLWIHHIYPASLYSMDKGHVKADPPN